MRVLTFLNGPRPLSLRVRIMRRVGRVFKMSNQREKRHLERMAAKAAKREAKRLAKEQKRQAVK